MADLVFTTIQIGRLIRPVSDMAEASKIFRSRIGNRGASNMPIGWLINAAGERVGHVSYNGRVWTGTPQDWTRDKQPLYCPSQVAIWSKFGLYRMASRAELPGIVDASPEEIEADLASKGFCLTYCDVERVAILRDYPADKEPDDVLAWVDEGKEADMQTRGTLKQDHTVTLWNCTFTLPKGTTMQLIKGDRAEFAAFCRNATTAQLRNIVDKEESAGRAVYAEIAKKELEGRN